MTPLDQYEFNLQELKNLIDEYTIADIESMIYEIPVKKSGACCYPAVQTLVALMELLGSLATSKREESAFKELLSRLGASYQNEKVSTKLYKSFRHGIAHSSLAYGGVLIKKDGKKYPNLKHPEQVIDIRKMFEDFLPVYNKLFSKDLREPESRSFYASKLRKVYKSLNLPWLKDQSKSLIQAKKEKAFKLLKE